MRGDHTIDLQDELIGWFLYGLGLCRGYFRADYSIVLILEAAIAKRLFVSLLWRFHSGGFLDF